MAALIHCINKVVALICCCWTDNHRVGVRVEDVMITDEPRIKTRTKIALIIASIIFVLCMICLIIYMYIATNTLDTEQLRLKDIDLQKVSVNVSKTHNASLEAGLGLQVSFDVADNLKAYPELGTFFLGTALYNNHTRYVYANKNYKISKFDQLILLNFQLRDLQKNLDNGFIWIRLGGDFKMLVKMAKFPAFPHAHKHAYFVCDVALRAEQPDKLYYKKCRVISQVPKIL